MYIIAEALPITNWVKLIDKKKFANTTLDENSETFIIFILALEAMIIHPFRIARIAALKWDKASTKILIEYYDYADIFSIDLVMELFKNTSINKYAIKLVEEKELSYKLIYALSLIKLEILKAYIEIYLKTGFIQTFKFLADAFK